MIHGNDDREWYAMDVVMSYVNKFLGGEIYKLAELDFSSIFDDPEFGGCDNPYRNGVLKTKLLTSILYLVFDGVWPEMNYDDIENNTFMADFVNVWHNHFSAVEGELDRYKFFVLPEEIDERVQQFKKRYYTLGNLMILPQGLKTLRRSKPFGRGYLDIFLNEFYKMMTRDKKCGYKMFDAMYMKSRELNLFRTKDNFIGVVEGLMLDSLLDEDYRPILTSRNFSVFDRGGCSRDVYVEELTSFLDFAEKIINERADRMMSALLSKLSNYEVVVDEDELDEAFFRELENDIPCPMSEMSKGKY